MLVNNRFPVRAFKSAWFTKAAGKAHIQDIELCIALRQIMLGQVVDLGGGVFKKRLNNNMVRSIVLAKTRRFWIYEYLFAKSGRHNIDADELADFRVLAKSYAALSEQQLESLLRNKSLVEICHGNET